MSLTMQPIKYIKMNICKISSQKESSDSFLLPERKGQTDREDFTLFHSKIFQLL